MEFRQIEHFLQLYHIQNMTKASNALFISQQGLSRSIKNLEDELQLMLFSKSQRGAIPTPQADALKPFFEVLLRDKALLLSQAEKLQASVHIQSVTIACGFDFRFSPISAFFRKFSILNPEIQIHFVPMPEKERFDALSSGKCSYALIDSPSLNENILSLGIIHRDTCEAVMRASHPLSHSQSFTWKMAQNMDIAVADPESSLERHVQLYLQQGQIKPRNLFTPLSMLEIIPKILQDEIIGILPSKILQYFDQTHLELLPIEPAIKEEIHLVALRSFSPTPSEGRFEDAIKEFPDWESPRKSHDK